MKILDGAELAGFVKERQAQVVRQQKTKPKLVILRDSDNPVIVKYVSLKKRYGEDIGVDVLDVAVKTEELTQNIEKYNQATDVNGIIVQLPLTQPAQTDQIVQKICPEKDVDDLTEKHVFDGATATAINWLLTGYNVDLKSAKIAIVGQGKLVGAPLTRIWKNSGYNVTIFDLNRGDLAQLVEFDIVVTATGQPHLIQKQMIKPGAVVVDAGTASEDGALVGDVDMALRDRKDLGAITPIKGGVGPLTVSALFENLLIAQAKFVPRH